MRARSTDRRHLLAAALALLAALALAQPARGARGLELGLTDNTYASADAGTRAHWLDRTVSARAEHVLLGAVWRSIAPAATSPAFDPRNPADPAYNWGTLDAAVADARSRGLRVTILVGQAPAWAEGPNRPSTARAAPGTWKPSPRKLKSFAIAIARRYQGQVGRYQLWAEPNLATYLTPQWRHRKAKSPGHYRLMLNAFFAGIKSVDRRAKVITGGTAPYGDPFRRGGRMQPLVFWRKLLDRKVRFNVAAVNPINVGAPTRHALNRDDLSTPDIGRLRRVLRKNRGHVKPKGKVPIWATELWWDSRPPDPDGLRLRKHARYLAQSFYVLWKQRVKSVVWFQIRDGARGGSFAATQQSGLFLRDGTAKPAYAAYRFPFVADRLHKARVRVWGMAPQAGKVQVQRRRGGGWRTVKRLRASRNRVFTGKIRQRGRALLRAKAAGDTSRPWKLR